MEVTQRKKNRKACALETDQDSITNYMSAAPSKGCLVGRQLLWDVDRQPLRCCVWVSGLLSVSLAPSHAWNVCLCSVGLSFICSATAGCSLSPCVSPFPEAGGRVIVNSDNCVTLGDFQAFSCIFSQLILRAVFEVQMEKCRLCNITLRLA